MRVLTLVAALMLSTPALADNCYVSSGGDRVTFLDDDAEPNTRIEWADSSALNCDWARSFEGTGTVLLCDDGGRDFISFGGMTLTAASRDLMAWRGVIWYQTDCPA